MHHTSRAVIVFLAVLLCVPAGLAAAGEPRRTVDEASLRRVSAMMAALSRESRRDAAAIEDAYGHAARHAGLADRDALAEALDQGHIRALPARIGRFNVRPRLDGAHPIGEKDLEHQSLYVAARPATLGLLLHVAARTPVPLDVTSLVRHGAYQRALQRTNPNARTSVPTHALGLAFDISVLYATPSDAAAIRDVLRRMRAGGALYFIAERNQLVFHVVPRPERLGFYAAIFDGLTQVPEPPRASPVAALLAVAAPPMPDTTWIQEAHVGGSSHRPLTIAYALLLLSIAISGVGVSIRRRDQKVFAENTKSGALVSRRTRRAQRSPGISGSLEAAAMPGEDSVERDD